MKIEVLTCKVCGKHFNEAQGMYFKNLETELQAEIKEVLPSITNDDFLCFSDILTMRMNDISQQIKSDEGEIAKVNQKILETISNGEFVTEKLKNQKVPKLTIGQKVADSIAKFGGSWRFILSFLFILLIWIILNLTTLFFKPFDPYPFILLNLVLSCLAAIQAPIIMMSQNRQEDRDRQQSNDDYKTNLTAEIEIRLLHEKLDHLLNEQMVKMLEIQNIQMQMLEELYKEVEDIKDDKEA